VRHQPGCSVPDREDRGPLAAATRRAARHTRPDAIWPPLCRATLVERGHVTADGFKAFTHDNALALWGDEMFADTVIAVR